MAVQKNMSDIEELGFLTEQKKTLVLPLPAGNKSVIVNYVTHISVTCVMPPAKREIALYTENGDSTVKIKSPQLLWRTIYCDVPMYGKATDIISGHYIYVLNSKEKTSIEACPYYISNVYSDGHVCFGNVQPPFSPSEAFNSFWESPFNDELRGEEEVGGLYDLFELSLEDYVKEYHKSGIKQQGWSDLTDEICGKKFWASPKGSEALLINSSKALLKKIPYKFWRKDVNGQPFIIALANDAGDHWEFNSGTFKFKLSKGFVARLPRFSKEANQLKKKFDLL